MRSLLVFTIITLTFGGCHFEPLKVSRTRVSKVEDRTYTYMVENVAGWNVHVEDTLWNNYPKWTYNTLRLFQERLSEIANTLPENAVACLRTIDIYLTDSRPGEAPARFLSTQWSARGSDPAMKNSVEFNNPDLLQRYFDNQPMIMLHELAHGYEYRFLTLDETVELARLYKSVFDGQSKYRVTVQKTGIRKHYALENMHEYFAESSEAYWGKNDYYPYDREQLKEYDPAMYEFQERVWYVNR